MILTNSEGVFIFNDDEVLSLLRSGEDTTLSVRMQGADEVVQTAFTRDDFVNLTNVGELSDVSSEILELLSGLRMDAASKKIVFDFDDAIARIKTLVSVFTSAQEENVVTLADARSQMTSVSKDFVNTVNESKRKLITTSDSVLDATLSLKGDVEKVTDNTKTSLQQSENILETMSDLQDSLDEQVKDFQITELYGQVAQRVAAALVAEELKKNAVDTYRKTLSTVAKLNDTLQYVDMLNKNTDKLNDLTGALSDTIVMTIDSFNRTAQTRDEAFVSQANTLMDNVKNAVQANVDMATQAAENQIISYNQEKAILETSNKITIATTVISTVLSVIGIIVTIWGVKHGRDQ